MNNRWFSVTCRTIAVDSFLLQKLHDFDVCQWGVVEGLQSRWGIFQACQILQATNTAQTIIWNISIILHGYWLFPRLNYWKRLGKETACISQYEYIRTVKLLASLIYMVSGYVLFQSSNIMRRPQNLRKISHLFWYLLNNVKSSGIFFQIFVAFSENLKFKFQNLN